nr:hypothetical protein StreXyl84_59370 [Streptomyces sp. Xyl84]
MHDVAAGQPQIEFRTDGVRGGREVPAADRGRGLGVFGLTGDAGFGGFCVPQGRCLPGGAGVGVGRSGRAVRAVGTGGRAGRGSGRVRVGLRVLGAGRADRRWRMPWATI